MYEITQKDLLVSGDMITSWIPDYEEFDPDLSSSIQHALVNYEGNYYIVDVDVNTNESVFPDEPALILDIHLERINDTFIWNQIREHIPDEDLETWDDETFDEEDWDWENDNE